MATPHWPVPCLRWKVTENTGTTIGEDASGSAEDATITTGSGSTWGTDGNGNVYYDFGAGAARAKTTTRTGTGPVYSAMHGASQAALEVIYDLDSANVSATVGSFFGISYGNPADDTQVLGVALWDSVPGFIAGFRGSTTVNNTAIQTGTPTTGVHGLHLTFDSINAAPRLKLVGDGATSIGTATLAANETLKLDGASIQHCVTIGSRMNAGTNEGTIDGRIRWAALFNERLSPGVVQERYTALIANSDSEPAAPKIVWHEASAVAVTANAAGTTAAPVPVYPPGIQSGDLLRCVVGQKPNTANGGGVTMGGSWTLGSSLTGAGGYGATLGGDTGNTNLYVFYLTATGSETGNCNDISCTDQNVTWAVIERFSKSSGTWDLAFATTSQTTVGSPDLSVTFGSDPGVQADDYVSVAMCVPTDNGSANLRWDTETITQTGVTYGTVYETTEVGSSNNNDIGGLIIRARANSGTSSAAPAMTANFVNVTTTNVRGPLIFMRLRAVTSTPSDVPGRGASARNLRTNSIYRM